MATPKLSMKLLIDNKSKRVLFAEAGKDVVDFLFSLLSMPIGSIINLLTEEGMVGCIGCIYNSIKNLDETYFQSNQNKNLLLNPTTGSQSNTNFLLTGSNSTEVKKYYRCPYNQYQHGGGFSGSSFGCSTISICAKFTDVCGTHCPSCSKNMTVEMEYVDPSSRKVVADAGTIGFVKGVVTYTVMDDLTVMPMSTISSITLLNKLGVMDVSSLVERTVNLGMKEGLELLKASLQSKMVLTDVFLGTVTDDISQANNIKLYTSGEVEVDLDESTAGHDGSREADPDSE